MEATLLILQKLDIGKDDRGDWLPRDHQDWTPLDLAAFYRHEDVVGVLDPGGKVESFAWMRPLTGSQAEGVTGYFRPDVVESVVPGAAEAPTPTPTW